MVETSLRVSAAWHDSAQRILDEGWHRILILGATDRGKSSYCRFLINAFLQEGRTVSFVDADIGQKDVGPPATITLADFAALADFAHAASTPMSQISACTGMYFVGHISPFAHFLPLVVGTRQMVETAKGEFVVIDTAGLVQGRGRQLAGFQIESLRPDVLVCLERGDELAPIRHAARHCNTLRVRSFRSAVRKSPEARRRLREKAFRTHFQDAREVEVRLDDIIVQRSSLFNGAAVIDPRFLYAESFSDGLIAVAGEGVYEASERVRVLPVNFADQLLCGVAGDGGRCLGLAICTGVDFAARNITLYTPVPKRDIRIILFGDLYLDQDGHELHLGRCGQF
jgi:polynucleotide 5'-hydroxyl-kinase GRC3/NOL9